jgi:hypothetical protein
MPLPKQSPGHLANDIAHLRLEGAAFAGLMAQQPPILILPLAPDLPLVDVVGGHDVFLSEFRLIE